MHFVSYSGFEPSIFVALLRPAFTLVHAIRPKRPVIPIFVLCFSVNRDKKIPFLQRGTQDLCIKRVFSSPMGAPAELRVKASSVPVKCEACKTEDRTLDEE